MLGDAIAQAIAACIVVTVLVTAAVTTLLIFGLPWLWSILKPWIHAITG